jgi:hypothetical protein
MFVRIDCHDCGGNGCTECRETGVVAVGARRPKHVEMPVAQEQWEQERESCPCYEGFCINDGVSQCTHIGGRDWCAFDLCPLVPSNAELT